MDFKEYQEKAATTAKYPEDQRWFYLVAGLASEAGEVADKFKKIVRDQDWNDETLFENKDAIKAELGDVLWYVSNLARELGVDLEDVAEGNIEKLFSRVKRDKIGGSGDNR